jgi:hypothetical protein
MGDNSKRRRIQIVDGDDDVIDAPVIRKHLNLIDMIHLY